MLAIQFEFTANRYHATQWGRHVNEGVLEWPPSPWRIMRAIVATWRRTLPDLEADRVASILEALTAERPSYYLPPASTGHTRHYMPYNQGSSERTSLVFDSFVAIQPLCPLFAIWQGVELDQQQTDDLAEILRNMPYLGRAESWVDAGVASQPPAPNSFPMENGALPDGDIEIVRTLVPRAPIQMEDLTIETSNLRRAGRIDPEGAQWWMYTRARDCFTSFRTERRQTAKHGEGATVVRFALSSNVLPLVKDTLRFGDLARMAAMSQFGRRNGGASSPKLSGKDGNGNPLKGHQHAFYLPTDEDGDGKIDHLTIWVPGGLSVKEFSAVARIPNLHDPRAGRDPVQVTYQSHGDEEDFDSVSPLFDRARRWRSLTPYILTRHVKRRTDRPQNQIEREVLLRPNLHNLANAEYSSDPQKHIEPMSTGQSGGTRPFDFFRHRRGGGSSSGRAYSFEIEFAEPVRGPIALGFGCHYGLGMFVPNRG